MNDVKILAVSIPQTFDDIDIFEDIKALLLTHQFVYIDMAADYNIESIIYRFQRNE
jgi:hypothetical protein